MSRIQQKTSGRKFVRQTIGKDELRLAVEAAAHRLGVGGKRWTSGDIKLKTTKKPT